MTRVLWRLAESDSDYFVGFSAARGGNLDTVALAFADQRARKRRRHRQPAGADIRFILADNLKGLLLVGLLVREGDPRPEFDERTRQLGNVDDLRPRYLVLKFDHPALDKALPVAGGMIFGVLRQIPMVSSLGDGPDDGRSVDGLQPLQLLPEPIIAIGRHRDLVHREGVRILLSNTAESPAAEQSKV